MNIELINVKNNLYDIFLEDTKVGWITYIQKGDSIKIDSLNIFKIYQRMSIGTSVIKLLFEKADNIYGESSPFAISFWNRLGAVFDYPINNIDISHMLNIGEFPPFNLSLENFNQNIKNV